LAFTTVLVIPLIAVVVEYRSYPAYSAAYDEGFLPRVEAFVTAGRNFFVGDTESPWSTTDFIIYGTTVFGVDQVILQTPRSIPYAGFEDLERAALIWTPMMLNPDKEGVQDANEVAGRYGLGTPGARSFVYMPTVGEGYRRFGWIGVPVVYFLAAVLYGGVAAVAWKRRGRPAWAAVLMFVVIGAGGAWSSTILSLLYQAGWVIPKFIVFFLVVGVLVDALLPARLCRRRPRPVIGGVVNGRA